MARQNYVRHATPSTRTTFSDRLDAPRNAGDRFSMRSSLLHAAALVAFAATTASAQMKALRFAAVVDGNGRVIPNGVVIVDGDKIARVLGPRDAIPSGAPVMISRATPRSRA